MEKLTIKQKRDLIAEIVGHRFCINQLSVRAWMNKNRIYNLNRIIELSKNEEVFLNNILRNE